MLAVITPQHGVISSYHKNTSSHRVVGLRKGSRGNSSHFLNIPIIFVINCSVNSNHFASVQHMTVAKLNMTGLLICSSIFQNVYISSGRIYPGKLGCYYPVSTGHLKTCLAITPCGCKSVSDTMTVADKQQITDKHICTSTLYRISVIHANKHVPLKNSKVATQKKTK